MNWEAIGAIGEVVGAVGVIVTLGYLAVQIRQNTSSVRAATLQEMTEASAAFHDLLASDLELARIFWKGVQGTASLTPEEALRFQFTMMSFLRRIEHFQRQTLGGRVSPDDWAGMRASTLDVMAQPGSRAWWAANAGRFNPDFGEWLGAELAERS